MALKGQLTLDELAILEVDADPSVSGVAAGTSSLSMLRDSTGATIGLWIKTGTGDTNWTAIAFTYAAPSSVGTANAAGSAATLVHSDHVHQGIHALKATSAGTNRFGDIVIEQGTNITVVDNGSGTFTINATGIVTVGSLLKEKAGTVTAGSFSGSPKKVTVTFTTPFANANYAIEITGTDNRDWTWESKAAGSFVINANANTALTGNVDWTAIATGEST